MKKLMCIFIAIVSLILGILDMTYWSGSLGYDPAHPFMTSSLFTKLMVIVFCVSALLAVYFTVKDE